MATTKTRRISADEQQRRAQSAAESLHSAELEGLTPSPAGGADMAAYVQGEFDADELVARTRARYGLA